MALSVGEVEAVLSLRDDFSSVLTTISENLKSLVPDIEGSLGSVGIAFGIVVAAATAAATAITELGAKGSEVNDVQAGFDRLAGSVGNANNILDAMRSGVAGTVDDLQLMTTANRLLADNVTTNAGDFGTLTQASQVLSREGFGPVGDVMNTVSNAMETGRVKRLALMGVTVDTQAAEAAYATALGQTGVPLSAANKLIADRQAVLQALSGIVGDAGTQELSFAQQVTQAKVAVENWFDELASGVASSPEVLGAIDAIRAALGQAFGGDAQAVLEAVLAGVNDFAAGVTTVAPLIVTLADAAKTLWDGLTAIASAAESAMSVLASDLWATISGSVQKLAGALSGAGDAFGQVLSAVGPVVGALGSAVWSAIVDTVGLVGNAFNLVASVVEPLVGWLTQLLAPLASPVWTAVVAAGQAIVATWDALVSVASLVAQWLGQINDKFGIVQGVLTAVTPTFSFLRDVVVGVIGVFTDLANNIGTLMGWVQRAADVLSALSGPTGLPAVKAAAIDVANNGFAQLTTTTLALIDSHGKANAAAGIFAGDGLPGEGKAADDASAKLDAHQKAVQALLDTWTGSGKTLSAFTDAFSQLTAVQKTNFDTQELVIQSVERLIAGHQQLSSAVLVSYQSMYQHVQAENAAGAAYVLLNTDVADQMHAMTLAGDSVAYMASQLGISTGAVKVYQDAVKELAGVEDSKNATDLTNIAAWVSAVARANGDVLQDVGIRIAQVADAEVAARATDLAGLATWVAAQSKGNDDVGAAVVTSIQNTDKNWQAYFAGIESLGGASYQSQSDAILAWENTAVANIKSTGQAWADEYDSIAALADLKTQQMNAAFQNNIVSGIGSGLQTIGVVGASTFAPTGSFLATLITSGEGAAKAITGITSAMANMQAGGMNASNLLQLSASWLSVAGAVYSVISAVVAANPATSAALDLAEAGTAIAQTWGSAVPFTSALTTSLEASVQMIQELGEKASWGSPYTLNLVEIVKELGGTSEMTGAQMLTLWDAINGGFQIIAQGGPEATIATTQLDTVISQMGKDAIAATGFVSNVFLAAVAGANAAGVVLPTVAAMLVTFGGNAIAGFNQVTAGVNGSIADLGALQNQALATFSAAVAGGTSFSAALTAIHPGLVALEADMTAQGVASNNTAMAELMVADAINNNNPTLMAAISGLTDESTNLYNMGMLNADTFGSMEQSGMTMYTQLQSAAAAAGGSSADALEPMQGWLHAAATEAQNLGVPLDANTQMLIDQSQALGVWQAAGESATDKLNDGVNALLAGIDALNASIGQFTNSLAKIPAAVNTTINTDYTTTGTPPGSANPPNPGQPPDIGGGGPGMNSMFGGLVYAAAGYPFVPNGTDTVPAMLTPGERVLSVADTQRYNAGSAGSSADVVAELRQLRALFATLPDTMARSTRDAALIANA